MTMPQIPPGRAPQPLDPWAEIAALRMQVDELTRRGTPTTPLTPICRVYLNVNVPMTAGADTWAQANWLVGEDPDGIATLSTVSGTNSYITIPANGRYLITNRGLFSGVPTGASCTAFISKGAANANNSIVRDVRNTTNAGSDGVTCFAERAPLLLQGDILYWGHWSSASCTLTATTISVPTEVSIAWLGTR